MKRLEWCHLWLVVSQEAVPKMAGSTFGPAILWLCLYLHFQKWALVLAGYWLWIEHTNCRACSTSHRSKAQSISHMLHWLPIKKIQTQFSVAVLISKAEVPRIHSFYCEPSRQMEDRAQLWIRNGFVVEYRVCNSLSQENRVSLSLVIFGAEHSSFSSSWTNYATIMKTSCLTREGT